MKNSELIQQSVLAIEMSQYSLEQFLDDTKAYVPEVFKAYYSGLIQYLEEIKIDFLKPNISEKDIDILEKLMYDISDRIYATSSFFIQNDFNNKEDKDKAELLIQFINYYERTAN